MVKYKHDKLDSTFQALADPTRRDILLRLAEKEHTVGDLAEPYDMSLAAVSKHLKVLQKADLIIKIKDGRRYRCRMNYEPLGEIEELMEKYRNFWKARFDGLEKLINKSGDPHE